MMRQATVLGCASALILLSPAVAAAQKLDLTISPITITFPSADPDVSPSVLAPPIVVTVRVRQNQGASPWQVTVLASGDLIAGGQTVDISNVTWTATPAPPFQNGILSKTVAQRIAAGTGSVNPPRDGSVTFRLANSWTYSAGTYTQTLVFTLSAP
jgi:P pilus assembly chaperone PapD